MAAPMSLDSADAEYVRGLVHRRAAIRLDTSQDYLIENRLAPLAEAQRISGGIAELVSRARNGDHVLGVKITEALATHETSFFRDSAPFDVLAKSVLPRLVEARRATQAINIWSAACSTGQEPYSLAMLLLEKFPVLESWRVRITATDMSAPVVAQAAEGLFKQLDVNRGLPASYLVKYFDREGASWRIKSRVRQLVQFRQANLMDSWAGLQRPDIVLLRNVLIYFDGDTKRAILDRVRQTIAADGALFLGSAETLLKVATGWSPQLDGKVTYYTVQP